MPVFDVESFRRVPDGTFYFGLINATNSYPFRFGRHVATGEPDDNEFILLRVG